MFTSVFDPIPSYFANGMFGQATASEAPCTPTPSSTDKSGEKSAGSSRCNSPPVGEIDFSRSLSDVISVRAAELASLERIKRLKDTASQLETQLSAGNNVAAVATPPHSSLLSTISASVGSSGCNSPPVGEIDFSRSLTDVVSVQAAELASLERIKRLKDTTSKLETQLSSGNNVAAVAALPRSSSLSTISASDGKYVNEKYGAPQKYAPPLPPLDISVFNEERGSCWSQLWATFAFVCTFFVPDCLIRRPDPAAKQAWREKSAICFIVLLSSAAIVGVFGFLPIFFCSEADTYTFEEIWAKNQEAWTVIHGTIYDMKDYINIHPGGTMGIIEFLGKDSSRLFPRLPPAGLPGHCLDPDKNLSDDAFTRYQCQDMTSIDKMLDFPCHTVQSKARRGDMNSLLTGLADYRVGSLAFTTSSLSYGGEDMDWIIIRDRLYNVTNYLNGLGRDKWSGKISANNGQSDAAYLVPPLHDIIVNKPNQDATDLYEKVLGNDDKYLECLDSQFSAGVIDSRSDTPSCRAMSITMYALLIFVSVLLVVMCLCSLLYLVRPHHTFANSHGTAPIMVMVPCYCEGEKELRKTIYSVLQTKYSSENKCLVVVADGMMFGKEERESTPTILSKILGFEMSEHEDQTYSYSSVGSLTSNNAKVYAGKYEAKGKILKYVVILKSGTKDEEGNGRAGNRGKRDSQLIITGLVNRLHGNRQLGELDIAICCAFANLGLQTKEFKHLMTIDADTRVHEDSISHMLLRLEKNESIAALCGETRVENTTRSLMTMIQVFEYFSSHNLRKCFESVFGCVTCLPGCFTMYRIIAEDGRPILAEDDVYREYARNDIHSLHLKNLYHLGEDRMLTTLLLKRHPDLRLSYVPEAICWTNVPHTLSILLSQRRRWTNSSYHNMLELLMTVDTMCGICFFSMKMYILIDLVSTMILPASLIYAGYFLYSVFYVGEELSLFVIILYSVIIGTQSLVFIFRSRWDQFFYFLLFTVVGAPLFYFIIPLYSFAKMDDFSWGATRQTQQPQGVADLPLATTKKEAAIKSSFDSNATSATAVDSIESIVTAVDDSVESIIARTSTSADI